LMPFMQVHAHLQAAAFRLYPSRKLLVPESSSWFPSAPSLVERALATDGLPRLLSMDHYFSIEDWCEMCEEVVPPGTKTEEFEHDLELFQCMVLTHRDAPDSLKFDLAQVWSMHSPSSYVTRYGFRRALTGENQDSPTSELDTGKYPSLEILKSWQSDRPDKFKYRAIMDAEDILKFMLSDFARKGQYDEIFEREIHWKGPRELVCLMQNQAQSQAQKQAQQPDADTKAPQSAPEAASPRRAFSSSCLERMPMRSAGPWRRPPLEKNEEEESVRTNALAPASMGKARGGGGGEGGGGGRGGGGRVEVSVPLKDFSGNGPLPLLRRLPPPPPFPLRPRKFAVAPKVLLCQCA